ncbi:arsenite methyltransferase isoform X1 [Chiloscyllium plagiosum]|uniref:arsenite methyltransferase isoform X1 n=1 Tax=Chiloscyllium plagiosum TaxID=36176 RepID=UPI001CB876A0|nr:arsenite methyltransferase isoform X1 [Chiloscyllium plagiosum]
MEEQEQQQRGAGDSSSGCSGDMGIHEDVKDYYGRRVQKTEDLVLNMCVTPAQPLPKYIRDVLKVVHEEVSSRYYGCGLVIPECLENCWILDLGSGSGRDCYMLSKLVGEQGHVTGIDMTQEQIQVAQKFIDYHTQLFGFSKPNVEFLQGYIEKLGDAGLKDNSFDIIISNCVINLSPDKKAVLKEAYRVLKDGGEMYFSDVYADCILPEAIRTHKVLWGECLGGALWWKDLFRIAEEVGFSTPRLATAKRIPVTNAELKKVVGDFQFVSATYRLFKIPARCPKEKCCVTYNGSIRGFKEKLKFDVNYTFNEGEAVTVDGEMAAILQGSRFARAFSIKPAGKVAPCSGGDQSTESKDNAVDPFKLTEQPVAKGTAGLAKSCCVQRQECC